MTWQKMRNKRMYTCSKCNRHVSYDEFEDTEDMCTYCVFPETCATMQPEITRDMGYPRNQTEMGYVMENLKDIPEELNPNKIFTKADKAILNKIKKRGKVNKEEKLPRKKRKPYKG